MAGRRLRWSTIVLLLAAPFAARAADLLVSYSVDDTALRKATVSGTPLTFTLFGDSACTTADRRVRRRSDR